MFFSSHGFGVFNVLMSFPLCSFVTWHMKLFLNEASLVKKEMSMKYVWIVKTLNRRLVIRYICDKTIFGIVEEASLV